MGIDLTLEKRQLLWQTLTPFQQQTLNTFKKYKIQSLFLTNNYLKDSVWLFTDFRENPAYPHGEKEQKLYCICGREIKYQYIIQSEETGEKLPLGSIHFSQHLGVAPDIAERVQRGIQVIDRGLDVILTKKEKNLLFPQKNYTRLLNSPQINQCSEEFLVRLAQFKKADLPLYPEDEDLLLTLTKQYGETPKWQQKNSLQQEKQLADQKMLLRQMIAYIKEKEIGEELSLHEMEEALYSTFYSVVPPLEKLLLLLTAPRFAVEVKKVGHRYYRIR